MRYSHFLLFLIAPGLAFAGLPANFPAFAEKHCAECHDAETKKGKLDLDALKFEPAEAANFEEWVKVFDRVRAGEMPPPKKKERPEAKELQAVLASLSTELTAADRARQQRDGRSRLRRMNRVEFENSVRELLAMPQLKLKESLPEDGRAHGFDRSAAALDMSFVHMESYLAAVDQALDAALCPLPEAPPVMKYRYRPWENLERPGGLTAEGSVQLAVGSKIAIGLIGMKRDKSFEATRAEPPSQAFPQIRDEEPKATAVGFFRHEDADFRQTMTRIQPYVSGWYKLRVSGYSFGWDGQQVVPTERHGALGWGAYARNEHYGTVDLPPNKAAEREVTAWLTRGGGMLHGTDDFLRLIGASLENFRDFAVGQNKDVPGPMTPAPGVAIEWVEIEGPLNEQWPPASHRVLFGDLPVKVWTKELGVPKPVQQTWPRGNPYAWPKDIYGERGEKRPAVYVESLNPKKDADRLLRPFLRRAFRRPVAESEVAFYVDQAMARIADGEAFQDAMIASYRAILTSPAFLLLREPNGPLDDHSLATRLSYFLWSSLPDAELMSLAEKKRLHEPAVLRAQVDRMLNDAKAERFVENFTGQWLALREIGATAPDKKLYPEFMPWLQDAMLLEAKGFFTELLRGDLGVANLVQADFAMINEPLAELYGIKDVRGWDVRRVKLPPDSPRGGFLTMAAVLKTTANGTTTSPVKRGAFVMDKLLGIVPTPPPPDTGSVEPDTRGTTTIRGQLDKHRSNATCAGCHAQMDPYGFALESFDVVGEWRGQYRATGGTIKDKMVNGHPVSYHYALPVDCSGQLPEGQPFTDVNELRKLLAAQPERLTRAFAGQLIAYATGAEVSFADRRVVDDLLKQTAASHYGVRSLIHALVQSELFRNR